MAAVKTLMAWLALLFHALFSLLLLFLGALALISGPQMLHLEMFHWSGAPLAYAMLFGGLLGLFSVALAILDRLRFLFLLWSLAVAVLLFKGLVFSGYRFAPGEWKDAAGLVAASLFAALGAVFLMRAKPAPGPRKYRVK